ncbi:MAG: hypothetical protein AAGG69_10265, partial [Pseudomonadota bacterium]
ILLSALWFAGTGPVVSAKIAHESAADDPFPQPIRALFAASIMLFWAIMLGIFVQECARLYIVAFPA